MIASLGATRELPSNAAGQQLPRAFDITPPKDKPTIKLFGWLRAFADYDADMLTPGEPQISYMRASQSIYESDDGWWVGAEVLFTHHNNLAVSQGSPTYRVLKTRDKQELSTFFIGRECIRALLAEIQVDYVQHIGGK